MPKTIALTRGHEAIVDDDDYKWLSKMKWHASVTPGGTVYAARKKPSGDGTRTIQYMHRVINETPDGMDTDHLNGNTLDNRKANLRACTRSENILNSPRAVGRGWQYCNQTNRWFVRVAHNGKRYFAGRYQSRSEAAAVAARARELLAQNAGITGKELREILAAQAKPDTPEDALPGFCRGGG